MSKTRMETDSYRITHYRITERHVPVPETRISQSMSEINAVQHRATGRCHESRYVLNDNIGLKSALFSTHNPLYE